jgi:hypothetical protein
MSFTITRCADCGASISLCDHAAQRLLNPERSFSAGRIGELLAEVERLLAENARLRAEMRSEQDRLCGYLRDQRAELDEARAALLATTPPPGAVVALVRATLSHVLEHNGHSSPTLRRHHLLEAERHLGALSETLDALAE